MTHYLIQTSYTPQGWSAMLKKPHNRLAALKPVLDKLGGTIVSGWMTLGDYDILLICKFPNNVSAAALSMAISAGGAVKGVKTTQLMTFEEGVEAMTKATEAQYQPPPSEFPYFWA